METKLSVLLVSDFPMLSGSIAGLLNGTDDVNVVACARTAEEALPLARMHKPKLAILDLNIDESGLAELVQGLTECEIRALMMADTLSEREVYDLLQVGVWGILPRRSDPEMVCKSVRSVAAGQVWISRELISRLVRHVQTLSKDGSRVVPMAAAAPAPANGRKEKEVVAPEPVAMNVFGLTDREMEILRGVGEGMTNKDIAQRCGISQCTVKHHLTNIFDKIGVDNRLELGIFAIHRGLIHAAAPPVRFMAS